MLTRLGRTTAPLLVAVSSFVPVQAQQSLANTGSVATMHASGSFEIKLDPRKDAEHEEFSRAILRKQFHGGLDGTSVGQMLSVTTAVKGSAGYVALERFTGTLDGHAGSFVLQHSGTMTRGKADLTLTVVPDSGTGELSGLTGSMSIENAGGQHSYVFDYTLAPEAAAAPKP